jgi:hypothetical protein
MEAVRAFFKHPLLYVWIVLIGAFVGVGLLRPAGTDVMALGPAPGKIGAVEKAQDAQPGQPSTEGPKLGAKPEDQPPSEEDKAYCKESQSKPDCLVQLRTARATEEQARWAEWNAHLVGATIALTLFTVIAGFLTVQTMRKSAETQLRAYISITPGNVEFRGRVPQILHFRVKNDGATPAYKVISFNAFLVLPHPLPPGYAPHPPDDSSAQSTNVVAPHGGQAHFSRSLGRPIPAATQALIRAGILRYYIFVQVRYEDAFDRILRSKKIRTTKLCASLPGDQMFAAMAAPPETILDVRWDFEHTYNEAD